MTTADAYVKSEEARLVKYGRESLAVMMLATGVLLLGLCGFRIVDIVHNRQPLVVRINEVGQAEAVKLDASVYVPQESELRQLAIQTVKRFYGRTKDVRTIEHLDDMDCFINQRDPGEFGRQLTDLRKAIPDYMASNEPPVDIVVKHVNVKSVLGGWEATAWFESGPPAGALVKSEAAIEFTATLEIGQFVPVPDRLVEVNPLGFFIRSIKTEGGLQ